MSSQAESLVIGGNHQNTLGVVVALGRKGISSHVIILADVESSYVLASKYVKCGYICKSESEVVTLINQITSTTHNTVVAIACSDDAAVLLDENYKSFPQNFVYPTVSVKGKLYSWTDKVRQTDTACSLGLEVPKSWIVSGSIIPDDIIYPCITKPITSVKNGKKGFCKCYNEKELKEYINSRCNSGAFQVQQYIKKTYEFQFLGCSLNNGGYIYIPGRTHIEATTGYNNLVFLKYDKNESDLNPLILKVKDFVRYLGYSGLFSVEFMRGDDGKDYFLEINCRNDGNGIAVTSAGTNLPYIWYLQASGGDYMSEIKSSHVQTTYMMPEVSFFLSMLNGEITFREWFADLQKTTCYLTNFDDDKTPYKLYLRSQIKILLISFVKYILVKTRLYGLIKKIKLCVS